MKRVCVVAAALVDSQGYVLINQRPEDKPWAGYWEFPGGKVKVGESPKTALVRELYEELTIHTWDSCLAPLTFVDHEYGDFMALVLLYVCRKWDGIAKPTENQTLKWVKPRDIRNFELLPANGGFVSHLMQWV